MSRKVAVLVRDRQQEALRMSLGLTLENNVSVFIMDNKLVNDENNALNVEMLGDMDAKIFSNNPENKFPQMTIEEIARALTEFDVVIPY